jgi:hypothetical protein
LTAAVIASNFTIKTKPFIKPRFSFAPLGAEGERRALDQAFLVATTLRPWRAARWRRSFCHLPLIRFTVAMKGPQ